MTDSRQAWLESLDPRVRAEVEAEIADYEDPDNAEYMDDEWQPGDSFMFEIGVAFTRDELAMLSKAAGRETNASQFIKGLVMERVAELLAERQVAATD